MPAARGRKLWRPPPGSSRHGCWARTEAEVGAGRRRQLPLLHSGCLPSASLFISIFQPPAVPALFTAAPAAAGSSQPGTIPPARTDIRGRRPDAGAGESPPARLRAAGAGPASRGFPWGLRRPGYTVGFRARFGSPGTVCAPMGCPVLQLSMGNIRTQTSPMTADEQRSVCRLASCHQANLNAEPENSLQKVPQRNPHAFTPLAWPTLLTLADTCPTSSSSVHMAVLPHVYFP